MSIMGKNKYYERKKTVDRIAKDIVKFLLTLIDADAITTEGRKALRIMITKEIQKSLFGKISSTGT